MDSAIHRMNHYPADSVIDFCNTHPLDSAIQRLNNRVQNSCAARARIISKKKPAVHENSFANLFSISQSNGKKEIHEIWIWIS